MEWIIVGLLAGILIFMVVMEGTLANNIAKQTLSIHQSIMTINGSIEELGYSIGNRLDLGEVKQTLEHINTNIEGIRWHAQQLDGNIQDEINEARGLHD